MKAEITINIDTEALRGVTEQHLACLWAAAQANSAPMDAPQAGEVAEAVGREIIRRFVAAVGLPLWNHQGRHAYAMALHKLGKWKDGEFVPNTTQEDASCTSL